MNLKSMYRILLNLVVHSAFAFSISAPAFADGNDCKGKDCPEKPLCFNVFCEYQKDRNQWGGFERCRAGSVFTKWVSHDGAEIEDISQLRESPDFEVECDEQWIFNNGAHRYTDYAGTRIQAHTGPYPAVVIPRGSLSDGHRYVHSVLELRNQRLEGYCYIYTGPQ